MTQKGEIIRVAEETLAEHARQLPTPVEILKAFIDRGVTEGSVAAVAELCALCNRQEDRNAERQFAQAFVQLQADLPKIQATVAVPNNDGTVRYHFAPFEKVMDQVGPLLIRHGFSVSFNTRRDQGTVCAICTLTHKGGHSRVNEFTVRIGQGPPKSTEPQADGAAKTYAKRFALCDALNIVVKGVDNDAAAEGDCITKFQADKFRERVRASGSDEKTFLEFAGAESYEKIPANRWATLDRSLKKKESTK